MSNENKILVSMGSEIEAAYREHQKTVDHRGVPVGGCWYCGGDHPSDCCPETAE